MDMIRAKVVASMWMADALDGSLTLSYIRDGSNYFMLFDLEYYWTLGHKLYK